ncbi:SRPBCC family protein [Mycolicibacterium sp. 120270]|uniref:SRPBCC family protein n=1 Tax=Mycolicibacterium sp. 120270 TaxID=3090600 RepID=UPI00299F460A|nr:SRPBCC family protein [Mycolicibacterium sp. 120270]MDX1883765.1 SRPBCC family protein [Mycolicibacterium sp. 120270]
MTTTTDVHREVTVAGTPERAFDLFTKRMADWWPAEHHLATSPVVAMTVEPEVGGRLYDTCADGSESVWGRVVEWNPPAGFTFAWMITGTWQLETDVEKASRVTVTFTAEGDRTRVAVVHKDFWRMREGGQGMADAVGAADGWGSGLARFAEFVGR